MHRYIHIYKNKDLVIINDKDHDYYAWIRLGNADIDYRK